MLIVICGGSCGSSSSSCGGGIGIGIGGGGRLQTGQYDQLIDVICTDSGGLLAPDAENFREITADLLEFQKSIS